MDGDEPQVGERRLENLVVVGRAVEPVQESRYFTGDSSGGNGIEENTLIPDRPGNNLHRPGSVAPGAESDFDPAVRAGRKKAGVPVEQSFLGDLVLIVP